MLGMRTREGGKWHLQDPCLVSRKPSPDLPPPPTHSRKGHTSIVKELKETLSAKPGAIALSVGGGGMLCGVVQGLQEVGWGDVPVIAMETIGAHSFHVATTAGKLVSLSQVTR